MHNLDRIIFRVLQEVQTGGAKEETAPASSAEPTKSNAQIFMANFIYGITAFIGLVALVLCCVAIY